MKLNLSKFKITHKGLYWGLIITFALLYLCVGFVSTLHSITFFHLANTMGLAILLGITYEVGQASVLFSILMTEKNKNTFLPWALMFLLTALQVTANVYASFKYIATSGSNDWQYWQKSILFGVQASSPEMYQMIISWIAGALLPIVALGMTALVAQNMNFITEESDKKENEKVGSVPDEEVDKVIEDEVHKRLANIIDTVKITDLDKSSMESEDDKFISLHLDDEVSSLIPEKEIISPKKEIKRPRKQKEGLAAPKKEKGLLQKEENVKVPQKEQNNIIDPLETKSTTQTVTDLDDVIKPSKGDEVIKLIENLDKIKPKDTITQPFKNDEMVSDASPTPLEKGTPFIENGIEVIDAKAVLKNPVVKKN